jgi:nucleoside-diphosphate-sugar epimerase
VDDVVEAMLLCASTDEANGKIYNLGASPSINLTDLAELLVDLRPAGQYVIKTFPADRKRIDIGDYYADFRKIMSELDWSPKVGLRDGLKETIVFYERYLPHYL